MVATYNVHQLIRSWHICLDYKEQTQGSIVDIVAVSIQEPMQNVSKL